jgi:hypothetical protein
MDNLLDVLEPENPKEKYIPFVPASKSIRPLSLLGFDILMMLLKPVDVAEILPKIFEPPSLLVKVNADTPTPWYPTFTAPARFKAPPMPTPPETTKAPVILDVLAVVSVSLVKPSVIDSSASFAIIVFNIIDIACNIDIENFLIFFYIQ